VGVKSWFQLVTKKNHKLQQVKEGVKGRKIETAGQRKNSTWQTQKGKGKRIRLTGTPLGKREMFPKNIGVVVHGEKSREGGGGGEGGGVGLWKS